MSHRRRRRVLEVLAETNLIPILSCMFLLVLALLVGMELMPVRAIDVVPPTHAVGGPTEQPPEPARLILSLKIAEDGYTLQMTREGDDGPTEQRIGLNGEGNHDREALESQAKELKERFPEVSFASVTAEGNVDFSTLVATLDALRGTECSLAAVRVGEEAPPECLFWNIQIAA